MLMISLFLLTTLDRNRSKIAFLVLCFKFKRGRNPRKRHKTGPDLAFEE